MQIKNDKQLKKAEQELEKLSKLSAVKKAGRLTSEIKEYFKSQNKAQVTAPVVTEDQKIIQERMNRINHLLIVKGVEYVRGGDRLHSFRRGAEVLRTNMPRALNGYLLKHLVSYLDMLDDIDKGKLPSDSVIEEKLGDILVYFFLQEVTIKQHIKEELAKRGGKND